jgi:hypothetical protein
VGTGALLAGASKLVLAEETSDGIAQKVYLPGLLFGTSPGRIRRRTPASSELATPDPGSSFVRPKPWLIVPPDPNAIQNRFRLTGGVGIVPQNSQSAISSPSAGATLSRSGLGLPEAFVEAEALISKRVEVLVSIRGTSARYSTGAAQASTSAMWNSNVTLGWRLGEKGLIGLGYEAMKFSYLNPDLGSAGLFTLNGAWAHELAPLARYRWDLAEIFDGLLQAELSAKALFAITLKGQPGDTMSGASFFAGYRAAGALNYAVTPQWFVGIYSAYTGSSLSWTQSGSSSETQTAGFSALTFGLQLGTSF